MSSEKASPRRHPRRKQGFQRDYDIKVDIPEFEGRIQGDEFIDWLNTVERVFDYKDVSDGQKVKLVAIKLKKHASIWWEQLKNQRACEGKRKIATWEKMKKELRKKFLPGHYRQYAFLKFHNFRQKDLSMEEYTTEFDHLKMRCDVSEPEEQTIARYLGGLRSEIANVVQLQPYWTYNDVFELAIKVELQLTKSQGNSFRSSSWKGASNRESGSISKPSPTPKPTNFASLPKKHSD